MPRPPTLRIAEVFASIQGEGLRQGEPTLFVRAAGCNLRCRFCDTKTAWKGGSHLTVEQIIHRLQRLARDFPAEWVCLTGGEPFLQDTTALVSSLKEEGWKVQAETNGTVPRAPAVDWLTVSPKPPAYALSPEYRRGAREVKLVVSRELTFGVVRRLRRLLPAATPLLLQPQSGRRGSSDQGLRLLGRCLRAGMKNVRLSVQAHKLLGVR